MKTLQTKEICNYNKTLRDRFRNKMKIFKIRHHKIARFNNL